jgi:hypothetical protein
VERLRWVNERVGLWPVRLVGLTVFLGVNRGAWHWVVGDIFFGSMALYAAGWYMTRVRSKQVAGLGLNRRS